MSERADALPLASRHRRRARIAVVVTAVGYALVCVIFALIQPELLYFPEKASSADEARRLPTLGAERVPSTRGDTLGYFVRSTEPARAVMIAAHGNGGNALGQRRFVALAEASGVPLDVFLVEYPGYGPRRGEPTERANVEALREAIARYDDRPIVLFGESLGSAVVALAAAERRDVVRALVLITPLPNLAGPMRHHYPLLPTFLLRDRYEADAAIARFGGPVAFVVAAQDEVIPSPLGFDMHDAYEGEKVLFVEEEAGHGNVDYDPTRETWQGVFRFVRASLGS